MNTLARQMRGLAAEKNGVAAIEFAFAAPILIVLLLGTVELFNEITAGRRLEQASYSIAQIISEAPNPPGTVNYADLEMAHDSAMLAFPLVLSDAASKGENWSKDISITISSVVIAQQDPACATNCQLAAQVAWTWGDAKRPCAVNLQPAASDAAAPTPPTLPPDAYAPGSLIVVDVAYNYTPLFMASFFHGMMIKRTTYLQPRNVPPTSFIQYATVSGDPGATTICPADNPGSNQNNGSGNNSTSGNQNGDSGSTGASGNQDSNSGNNTTSGNQNNNSQGGGQNGNNNWNNNENNNNNSFQGWLPW